MSAFAVSCQTHPNLSKFDFKIRFWLIFLRKNILIPECFAGISFPEKKSDGRPLEMSELSAKRP